MVKYENNAVKVIAFAKIAQFILKKIKNNALYCYGYKEPRNRFT